MGIIYNASNPESSQIYTQYIKLLIITFYSLLSARRRRVSTTYYYTNINVIVSTICLTIENMSITTIILVQLYCIIFAI